jgi:hypothetical protein
MKPVGSSRALVLVDVDLPDGRPAALTICLCYSMLQSEETGEVANVPMPVSLQHRSPCAAR